MKHCIIVMILCICTIASYGYEQSSSINMGVRGLDSDDHYSPHVYNYYQSGIVHTEQLKMLEYQIQRLDRLHTNLDTIKSNLDTIKSSMNQFFTMCVISLVALGWSVRVIVKCLKDLREVETKHKQHFDTYADWMSETMNTVNNNIIKA